MYLCSSYFIVVGDWGGGVGVVVDPQYREDLGEVDIACMCDSSVALPWQQLGCKH